MKKIFLAIFLIGICFSTAVYFWQSRASQVLQAAEVTPEQLKLKIEAKEDFYVYFYAPTCKDCLSSEPKLARAAKDLSVNIVKLDVQKYESLREELQIPGTPSIFYYQDQKLVKGITGGLKTVEEYKNFFREKGGTI